MTQNINTTRTPLEKLREFLVSAVEDLRHVPGRVFGWKVTLELVRGTIGGTDQTAHMLYVGRGFNQVYLKSKLLCDAEVVQAETATVFSYRAVMARLEQEADFTFVDIGLPYQLRLIRQGGHLVLPDWISMIVPLPKAWDSIESGFNKTTRKMIRKIPYRYEVSHAPEVIEAFYDDYYLPYLMLRHQDAAVEPRKAIERRAKQGGILQVIGDEGPVVAGVVYPQDGVLYYLWLGVAKQHLDNQPENALFASYYFCLRFAHENGFRAANWMGTRSFPTDGVFQFKRKWGTLMEDSFSPESLLFKPAANNRKAIAFAERCPLVARRAGKLEQIFCSTADTLSETDIKRMIAGYSCAGIEQITVIHVTDQADAPEERRVDVAPNLRVITVGAPAFASLYAPDFSL